MTLGALTTPRLRRVLRGVSAAAAALAVLVACGGGTTQREPFVPGRYFAFGDEASVITGTGRKFTVNALDANDNVDCTREPLWVQVMASNYNFAFIQCNPPTSTATPNAFMLAAAGAKAADLRAQIDAQVARGPFVAKDLATVLVGTHDVLELYADFPRRTEAQLLDDVRARGDLVAQQVNRLVNLGARVVVSTIPDLGVSPYALQQKAAFTDTDRAALIGRLTAAFNSRVRVGILNDGRFVGLVLADELTQTFARAPGLFGVSNVTDPLCTVALPDCTSKTVVAGGTSLTYLWADGFRMTYAAQQQLGQLALSRATGNPF